MVGDLVGTLMTNLGLEVALRDLGIGLARVNVGDRYILEKLQQESWVLGGEPSGHIICLDRTTTGDGIVSALQVLAELADSHQTDDGRENEKPHEGIANQDEASGQGMFLPARQSLQTVHYS